MKLLGPISRLTAILMSVALVGVACSKGSGTSQTGTVSFLTFQNSLLPDVIRPFTQANPNLKLQATTFSTEDDAVAKLQAGFKADVVYACLTDTQRLVSGGLVQPIDTSRITAWNTLFPYFRDSTQIRVNSKVYMIPAFGGTTGLIYNPDQVPGGVTSFRQLIEDPALKGKVTIEDNPKYGIAMGALALGYKDPYNLSDADLQKIKQWYIQHKAQIRGFFASESDFFSMYQSGEVIAGFGYKGYDVGLAKQHLPVAFAPASEGALTWTCGYSIGANAQNLDGAYALLNWFLNPKTQAVYATNLDQMPTNQATLASLPRSLIQDVGLSDLVQLEASIPTEIPSNYDQWQKVWRQITSA
jgi:spermidine/putrescine-binding protein